jgi:hypothetical protein
MAKKNKYNRWEIAAFVSFGAAVGYVVAALVVQRCTAASLPGELLLLPCALFIACGTTGAIKKGEFFVQHGHCTRAENPIAFWAVETIGYLFSSALIAAMLLLIIHP